MHQPIDQLQVASTRIITVQALLPYRLYFSFLGRSIGRPLLPLPMRCEDFVASMILVMEEMQFGYSAAETEVAVKLLGALQPPELEEPGDLDRDLLYGRGNKAVFGGGSAESPSKLDSASNNNRVRDEDEVNTRRGGDMRRATMSYEDALRMYSDQQQYGHDQRVGDLEALYGALLYIKEEFKEGYARHRKDHLLPKGPGMGRVNTPPDDEADDPVYTWGDMRTFLQWTSEGIGAPPVMIGHEEKETVKAVIRKYKRQGSIQRDAFVEEFIAARVDRIVSMFFGEEENEEEGIRRVEVQLKADKGGDHPLQQDDSESPHSPAEGGDADDDDDDGKVLDPSCVVKTARVVKTITCSRLVETLVRIRRAQYGMKKKTDQQTFGGGATPPPQRRPSTRTAAPVEGPLKTDKEVEAIALTFPVGLSECILRDLRRRIQRYPSASANGQMALASQNTMGFLSNTIMDKTTAIFDSELELDREVFRRVVVNAHGMWAARPKKDDANVTSGKDKLKDLTLYLFPDEEMSPQVLSRLLVMIEVRPDMTSFTNHYSAQRAQKSRDIRDLFIFLPLIVLFVIVAFAGRGLWDGEYDGYSILNAYQSARDSMDFSECAIIPSSTSFDNATNATVTIDASIECDADAPLDINSLSHRSDVLGFFGSFTPALLWPDGEDATAGGTKVASALSPIGALRIRQKRVAIKDLSEGINLGDGFDTYSYPQLSRSDMTESTDDHTVLRGSPIIQANTIVDNGGPLGDPSNGRHDELYGGYRYQTCTDLASSPYILIKGVTRSYGCGGYVVDIPFNATRAGYEAVVAELFDKQWIDKATRVIIMEYFLLHQNSGMLLMVKHQLELYAGGGLTHTTATSPFFLEVKSVNETRTLVAYVFFIIFLFGFGLRLLHRVWLSIGNERTIRRWVADSMELINFAIFIFSLATYRGVTLRDVADIDPVWQLEHYPRDYETMFAWFDISVILNCVNIVLSCMLALMYTQHMMGFATVVRTLQRAIKPGVALAFVAVMILVGFSMCAACAFGQTVMGYHTMGESILTLLTVFWDGWDFTTLYTTDQRSYGYVFIFFFNTFFVLFLLNAVVAVFADAFSDEGEAQFDPTDLYAIAAGDYFATLRKKWTIGHTAKLPFLAVYGFLMTTWTNIRRLLANISCLGISSPHMEYNFYNYHTLLNDDLRRLKDVSEMRSYDFVGAIRSAVRILREIDCISDCVPDMEIDKGYFSDRLCVFEFCRTSIFGTEDGDNGIDYNLIMMLYVVIPQFAFGSNALVEIVEAAASHKLWWSEVEEATIIADSAEERKIMAVVTKGFADSDSELEEDDPMEDSPGEFALDAHGRPRPAPINTNLDEDDDEEETDPLSAAAFLETLDHLQRRSLLGILGAYYITYSSDAIKLIEGDEKSVSARRKEAAAKKLADDESSSENPNLRLQRDRGAFLTKQHFEAIVTVLKDEGKLPAYFRAEHLWGIEDIEEKRNRSGVGEALANHIEAARSAAAEQMGSPKGKPPQLDDSIGMVVIGDLIPLIQIEFTTQCLGLSFYLDEALEFSKQARRIATYGSSKPRKTLDVTEFSDAWEAAKGSPPSAKVLKHVCSIFPDDKIQWQVFAHACQADPLSLDCLSFPTSFSAQLSRNRTNAMSYLIYIPTLVIYFVYLIFITQGEAIHMSESLRDSFAPEGPAGNREEVESYLRNTVAAIWDEDEEAGVPRVHSETNYFLGALRVMQWRVTVSPRDLCKRMYTTYFGDLANIHDDAGTLRFPHADHVSDEVKDFYNERVGEDFPGVYTMGCVGGWNKGKYSSERFTHIFETIDEINITVPIGDGNESAYSAEVTRAFTFRKFGTASVLSQTRGHDGTYGAEGFYFDIPFSLPYSDAMAMLNTVLDHEWVDLGTRMVVARAVVYNHNLKMAAAMRFGYEISSGGNMAEVVHMDVLSLTQQAGDDLGVSVMLVLLLIFAVLYATRIAQEAYIIAKRRLRLQSAMHVNIMSVFTEELYTWMGMMVHCLCVVVLLMTTVWRMVWWSKADRLPGDATITNNGLYPEAVEYEALLSGVLRAIEGTNYLILTILCTIFITASLRFEVILETISAAYGDLMAIGTLFIVVVVAFSCAVQLLWGYDLDNSFSFANAFIYMFIGATGGGGIPEDSYESRPVVAPIFQIIYVLISSIILCNTVTGILTDALSKVKEGKYDDSLALACLRRYGGKKKDRVSEEAERCKTQFARIMYRVGNFCREAYEALFLRSLIGSFFQMARNTACCGQARTTVQDYFGYSIHSYWSSMEKWWLMVDCGTPGEAAKAGANLLAILYLDPVIAAVEEEDVKQLAAAEENIVDLTAGPSSDVFVSADVRTQEIALRALRGLSNVGTLLFANKASKNNFVLYGPYRRLPVWEELLFSKFQEADGSSTYRMMLDYFITVPNILFGQDEERMGLSALQEKHYYDSQQRAFGAHLRGGGEDEDD